MKPENQLLQTQRADKFLRKLANTTLFMADCAFSDMLNDAELLALLKEDELKTLDTIYNITRKYRDLPDLSEYEMRMMIGRYSQMREMLGALSQCDGLGAYIEQLRNLNTHDAMGMKEFENVDSYIPYQLNTPIFAPGSDEDELYQAKCKLYNAVAMQQGMLPIGRKGLAI